jgi:hypothetical protein
MQSQSQSSTPSGARTRRGTPCSMPAMPNGRCRMHATRDRRAAAPHARSLAHEGRPSRGRPVHRAEEGEGVAPGATVVVALQPCRRRRASRLSPYEQNPKNNPMQGTWRVRRESEKQPCAKEHGEGAEIRKTTLCKGRAGGRAEIRKTTLCKADAETPGQGDWKNPKNNPCKGDCPGGSATALQPRTPSKL